MSPMPAGELESSMFGRVDDGMTDGPSVMSAAAGALLVQILNVGLYGCFVACHGRQVGRACAWAVDPPLATAVASSEITESRVWGLK